MKHFKQFRLFWLSLLNLYHVLLATYWILRALFGGAFWWLALLNTFALFVALPLLLTLPVALLLRGKKTSALAIFLTVLALVKYVPLPKATPLPADHTLRVITYNIWGRNGQLNADVDWLLAQDADVIVIAEANNHLMPGLSRLVRHYPYDFRVEGSIFMVSRYAMLERHVAVLEVATNRHNGRQGIRAVLDVNGQPITVYGVHLSVPRSNSERFPFPIYRRSIYTVQHYDETRRNAQIATLIEMVKHEAYPVIIAGDFNTSHTSAAYDTLREAGLVDAYATAGAGFGMSWPAQKFFPPLLRIDYIWHTASLRTVAAKLGEERGSDHLPLIADLALPE